VLHTATFNKYQDSADGVELTIAVNHLAPFIFTVGLKKSLTKGSRVITTMSRLHNLAKFNAEDLGCRKGLSGLSRYATSKLYNVIMTRELSKRWAQDGILVNCVNPGLVNTGFGAGELGFLAPIMWILLRIRGITAEEGGAPLTYLATSDEVDGITGKYFDRMKESSPSKEATNDDNSPFLWRKSTEWASM
jgi:retinol dehydrogenase-12